MSLIQEGASALQRLLEKARQSRDIAVNNKRMRRSAKVAKDSGSHRPNAGRSRQKIMDELT